ncbi:MAG: hypothetical protein LBS53_01260 [Synergistaceae bacterium]|jgi:hypothetical protein|nr:hypothetical protein [Synergistaceae bacterium]
MTGNPHKWRDVAWKRAIVDGARDAIAYFMPDLASDMDTSREVVCITGVELPVKDSDKGMLVSDVFLNVPVKGGEDWSVACLAEQQDAEEKGERGEKSFAARMFDSLVRLRATRPVGRIFRLSDSRVSEDLREAFKLHTISLEQYVAEIDKEEARMEGMEQGMEKGKFEIASKTSVSDIVDITG